MNVIMATRTMLCKCHFEMAFAPLPNPILMLIKWCGNQPMMVEPKSFESYNLFEVNFNKLDGWGIHKWQESLGDVDSQCDPYRMEVDLSEKGSGFHPTSPTLAM